MTMNFYVANSVDFDQLKGGQLLHIEVTKNNSADVQITGTHIMGDADFPTATVDGRVEAIDAEQRVLQLMRDAIPKWQRPAASMAFMLDEHVEIGDLTVGDGVSFTFQVRDDLYVTDLSRHNSNEQVNDND
jgi:Cu(I)/Ag(I) efflux system membrane fusion protein